MTMSSIIALVALLATAFAAEVPPEVFEVLEKELQDFNVFENVNTTELKLALRADHPHAHVNIIELAALYDYTAETHTVLTDDGYILEMHRITGNKENPSPKGKPAVILQHGLLCSSMDWTVTGPDRGLGFILADEGYDVWLGNARGNRHSRKHANLSLSSDAYWDFSWHEMGAHDLPAMVDYVLGRTGQEKLSYVGHSQGSTSFFVMLSERPEYNDKINVMFSLAPVAYCSHMTSPVFRFLGLVAPVVETIMGLLGQHEFVPGTEFFKKFAGSFCKNSSLTQPICENVIFLICGYSEDQMDKEMLPAFLAHTPAGASTKQFTHYAQLIHSGKFRQFDHGWLSNKWKYGTFTPPLYKLSNIKVPVSLHYAVNDMLSNSKDVENLHSQLPNPVGKFRVPHDKFNHLDFLWGKDAKTLLYDKVVHLLKNYQKYSEVQL